MRICGGKARGILLKTLPLDQLRPATDMLRLSIFNSLGNDLSGLRFLDLFAGSGAYGLEAISRGASSGLFVELHAKLAKIIADNLMAVTKSAKADVSAFEVRQTDALRFAPSAESFDVVFCDPPYDMIEANFVALGALARQALKMQGLFLMEFPRELGLQAPAGFLLLKRLGGKDPRAPNIAVMQRIS